METTHTSNPLGHRTHTANARPIDVIEVTTSKQLKEFINLPKAIYTEPNTRYVQPLSLHLKMMMGKLGAPQKHFFLAYDGKNPVARLGAKVHSVEGHTRLHFGFFECVKGHADAVKQLVDKAHSLYPDLEMMGPFHFRQEDPYIGVLVEGFQHDPYFMMSYNPAYYDEYLTAAGVNGVMDLFTYGLKRSEGLPDIVLKNSAKCREKGITFRALDRKALRKEARLIASIFNEALSSNWGFEEFLDDQIGEMVTMLKLFIDPRVVLFAMKDGKEIGCLLMIPNYNHLIKKSKGRLTPGLIVRYLRRAKTTDSIRGYALGVLKAYQGLGVGSALTDEMYRVSPYETCEVSWVLANNSAMNDLAQAMGGKRDKVYRIYNRHPIIKGHA